MCITRVGRVTASSGGKAAVRFFDGHTADSVDISMIDAEKGAFVEVFGNLALSTLTADEARRRRAAWKEVQAAPPRVGTR